MKIEALMTRNVMTCRPWESGARAAQAMWDFDCGALPVTDLDGHVLGMVTDRDLCMAAYTRGKGLGELSVQEVLSRPAIVCDVDAPLSALLSMMREHKVRRIPVVDSQRRLVGIVSLADVLREAADDPRREVMVEALDTTAAVQKRRFEGVACCVPAPSESRGKAAARAALAEEALRARQADLEC